MSGKKGLTPRQLKFAQEFAKHGNATAAYRAAGYKTEGMKDESIWRTAHGIKENPKVAAKVDELKAKALEKQAVTVEKVIQEIANIALLDPAEIYNEDGSLKDLSEMKEEARRAIASIEKKTRRGKDWDEESLKVTLHSKIKALELLGRQFGIFKDKIEVDHKVSLLGIIKEVRD